MAFNSCDLRQSYFGHVKVKQSHGDKFKINHLHNNNYNKNGHGSTNISPINHLIKNIEQLTQSTTLLAMISYCFKQWVFIVPTNKLLDATKKYSSSSTHLENFKHDLRSFQRDLGASFIYSFSKRLRKRVPLVKDVQCIQTEVKQQIDTKDEYFAKMNSCPRIVHQMLPHGIQIRYKDDEFNTTLTKEQERVFTMYIATIYGRTVSVAFEELFLLHLKHIGLSFDDYNKIVFKGIKAWVDAVLNMDSNDSKPVNENRNRKRKMKTLHDGSPKKRKINLPPPVLPKPYVHRQKPFHHIHKPQMNGYQSHRAQMNGGQSHHAQMNGYRYQSYHDWRE